MSGRARCVRCRWGGSLGQLQAQRLPHRRALVLQGRQRAAVRAQALGGSDGRRLLPGQRAHRSGPRMCPSQLGASAVQLLEPGRDGVVQLDQPVAQRRLLRGGRGGLGVQGRPRHRIGPGASPPPGPLVPGPGRGPLPTERVAGVQPPQPAVVPHPGGRVVDQHRGPGALAARPDGRAVPAGVVDERDAERGRRPLGDPGEPPTDRPHHRVQLLERRGLHRHQVLAGQVRTGMGPGAGVDDGVHTDPADVRVVVAAAQVGPHLVVRGERDPRRAVAAVGVQRQVERDLLPVGLVVVDPGERRPPVVHGVEEPVLQHQVARVLRHVAVVGVLRPAG